MKGYLLQGRPFDVVFDYDNRPGLYINNYALGGTGGRGPNGTPQTHPWGFRKGIVIRDNYIFCTGRCAISFTGDGTICANNVIRFRDNRHIGRNGKLVNQANAKCQNNNGYDS